MKRTYKHVMMTCLGLFVTAALCYWALRRMDVAQLKDVLTEVNLYWFATGSLVVFVSLGIQAFRWGQTLPQAQKPHYKILLHVTLISSFFNNLLPALIGGDIYRGTRVAKDVGVKETIQSLIVVRLTNLWGAALLPLLFAYPYWGQIKDTLWFPPLILLSTAAWVGAFLLMLSRTLLIRNEHRWASFRFASIVHVLLGLTQDLRTFCTLILSSWLFQFSTITSFYCFMQAVGMDLPFGTLGLLVPAILILTTMPISFNGLGVRESAFMITLASWDIPSESAFALSIVAYAGLLVTGLFGGILFVAHFLKSRFFHRENIS